jgi:ferrochelatase
LNAASDPGSTPGRTGVLLINLGTPDAPTAASIRRYLGEFLSDPRVVELPRCLWWPILHGLVLRTRPRKLAPRYASIWQEGGSPLMVYSRRQAEGLAERLRARGLGVDVALGMRYGKPSVADALATLRAAGCDHILVLPLYPQYAASTTATAADALAAEASRLRDQPALRFVKRFYDDPGYLDALASRIGDFWQAHGRPDRLLMSFHGLPRQAIDRGDPYLRDCLRTAELLRARLRLSEQEAEVTFQSRFGAARWLEPYTEPRLRALPAEGVASVDVVCPGFVADCLETLEEIDQLGREAFLEAGGKQFRYIPALNDTPAWLDALTSLTEKNLQGWPT